MWLAGKPCLGRECRVLAELNVDHNGWTGGTTGGNDT